jgi:teichuronic acid biosynthesis glycosyltransferase TuaG
MSAFRVTVIMPAYDSAADIGAAIASVQAQTETAWELMVIDDGSRDETPQIAADAQRQDGRVRLIRLARNGGPAVARNAGIAAARGRYIAFLDSDDLWLPDKLARQLRFMEQRNAGLSYTGFYIHGADGRMVGAVHVPPRLSYRDLLRSNRIGCLTAIYDRQMFGTVEMPDIRQRQDLGLWLRLLRQTPYAYGLDEPLAIRRLRPGSLSAAKLRSARYTWQLYRRVERLPLPAALWYFGNYSVRSGSRWLAQRHQ